MRFFIWLVLLCLATPATASADTPNRYQQLNKMVIEGTVIIPEIQDATVDDQNQILCLALNIYHESRGEDQRGRWAVGFVTLTRVKSVKWHNSVCEVVWARSQFSWTVRPLRTLVPNEVVAWTDAQQKAHLLYTEQYTDDPTQGADHFYAARVKPNWARRMASKLRIGSHIFAKLQ